MTDDHLRRFLGPYMPDPEEPRCPQCGMTEVSIFVCPDDWHGTRQRSWSEFAATHDEPDNEPIEHHELPRHTKTP